MTTPSATDSIVRPARPEDADALGRIHALAWQTAYEPILGAQIVAGFRASDFATSWGAALERHRDGGDRHFLLVACAGPAVVGFVAGQPGGDPDSAATDAEFTALLVDPAAANRGHGSRLLAAATDLCVNLTFDTARIWVLDGDDAHATFLTSAGFARDGAWRETEIEPGHTVVEHRYATALG